MRFGGIPFHIGIGPEVGGIAWSRGDESKFDIPFKGGRFQAQGNGFGPLRARRRGGAEAALSPAFLRNDVRKIPMGKSGKEAEGFVEI